MRSSNAATPWLGYFAHRKSREPRPLRSGWGPSSINWPIIRGDNRTGLTIFRPNDGLDEGPIILQKETPIGPDDTLGTVYFERLFPLGVAALLEAAEMVARAPVPGTAQNDADASYEGWCRSGEAQINWHHHVDTVYNLIRDCDPSPGAWTLSNGSSRRESTS